MIKKHLPTYLPLVIILVFLSLAYLKLPPFRLIISIIMGLSYLIWGLITHLKDNTLHLLIVLEYLGLSLLATMILIFISLRV